MRGDKQPFGYDIEAPWPGDADMAMDTGKERYEAMEA